MALAPQLPNTGTYWRLYQTSPNTPRGSPKPSRNFTEIGYFDP